MRKIELFIISILFALNSCVSQTVTEVERFGFFETSFRSTRVYENPYVDLRAEAEITRPDGSIWKIPLFWDGENKWKLRVSPDLEGEWSFKVISADRGLNRKSGYFTCVSSSLRGTIKPMDGFPYHFQYQNGEKMWFLGETAWALFSDNEEEKLNRASFEHFVTTRASQGFNVVHAMMLSEAGWGNSGGMPFLSMEKQTLNPVYWQEIDSRVAFANQQGMVVGLVIAWGDKNKKVPFPWRLFPDIEARKHYARYIAARYSAYNVYFIVSGEWHGEVRTRQAEEEEVRKEFFDIGSALDSADPHGRMIGIHPMNSNGSVREFNEASWMSFGDYQQNYQQLHGRILESRVFNKPIVNSEYGYYLRDQDGDGVPDKDNSTSLESMRHASWDIVMAGGYFVTGFGTTYFGGHRDPGPFDVDAIKNDDWELQTGYIKKFFEGIDYWKLTPNDSALMSSTPRSGDSRHLKRLAPPSKAWWLLEEQGRQYLLYARGLSGKLVLGQANDLKGRFTISLFNPGTGETAESGNVDLNGTYQWTIPDKNDWVLYLEKQ